MKTVLCYFLLLSFWGASAQIPSGYYNGTQGLTGYALKTELNGIISQGYIQHSYGDLWAAFDQTDEDNYYENDGTVLDIYSENPNGTDAYEYTFSSDQCGNYGGEGDCYNREHLMPQSWFDENYPMKADIHHIYPTDGYVNGRRGHLPFGEVTNPTYTSANGSKKGPNAYPFQGAYSGTVFEPIDEFKGDIARVYFYMATRYENKIGSWQNVNDGSQNTLNGTSDQVFTDWMLNMLLEWNAADPVSQREINRNNAAYDFQGNRNPFIDHPEFVAEIWGQPQDSLPSDESVLVYANFNDCTTVSTTMQVVSEMSAVNWTCISSHGVNGSGAMQMNAYANGQQVPSVDWLITTDPIDFTHYTDEKLSLHTEATFGNTALQLVYSTDYNGQGNPSNFTWQAVPNITLPLYPQGESGPVETSYTDIDISGVTGQTVYFAFKYDNSNGEDATRWTLDNFKITGTEALQVETVRSLEFSIYPNPISYGEFTIVLPKTQQFTYRIYDMKGRLLLQGISETTQTRVPTSKLSSGIYLIKLFSAGHTATAQLIVK